MFVSFVIPCYRSESTIQKVVEEINATIENARDLTHEIVLVNDSSPDNTEGVIRDLCRQYKHIKAILLSRNFGQHSALMAGLRNASGEIVICLDDDGQTPPGESIKLIGKLLEGYDIVFARYQNKKHSLHRNLGSKANDWMARKLLGKPKHIFLSSFFAVKSFIVKEVIRYDNPYPYLSGLLLRSTNRIANTDIVHLERQNGKSGYSLKRLIRLWLNGLTNFSVKPLRIATLVGILFSLLGFFGVLFILINKLVNPNIEAGWTSLMAAIVFIGGIILIVLGMVGEYVGRIFVSLNKSPQYVVRETLNMDNKE